MNHGEVRRAGGKSYDLSNYDFLLVEENGEVGECRVDCRCLLCLIEELVSITLLHCFDNLSRCQILDLLNISAAAEHRDRCFDLAVENQLLTTHSSKLSVVYTGEKCFREEKNAPLSQARSFHQVR